MYNFFVVANLSANQRLALCGAADVVGGWDENKAVELHPVGAGGSGGLQNWTAQVNMSSIGFRYFEYRYIKLNENGKVDWEGGDNRNVWVVPHVNYTLNDGAFGHPLVVASPSNRGPSLPRPSGQGLRVAICGSSVAFGWRSPKDEGWSTLLANALKERYGHQTVNVAVHGYDTKKQRANFNRLVASVKPDVVVIGLSLANEGLSWGSPRHWRVVARSFQNGIRALLSDVAAINAVPVLGDVYPHGNYWARLQQKLLQDTHKMLLNLSVPVLGWLDALDNGEGRWRMGHMDDPGHPNGLGHQTMFNAIDLAVFDPENIKKNAR